MTFKELLEVGESPVYEVQVNGDTPKLFIIDEKYGCDLMYDNYKVVYFFPIYSKKGFMGNKQIKTWIRVILEE